MYLIWDVFSTLTLEKQKKGVEALGLGGRPTCLLRPSKPPYLPD